MGEVQLLLGSYFQFRDKTPKATISPAPTARLRPLLFIEPRRLEVISRRRFSFNHFRPNSSVFKNIGTFVGQESYMQKSNPLNINRLDFQSVPRAGIEPARPFRAKGFSYHNGFRHHSVCGLDYSFTIGPGPLGVSCLVSAPSSSQRLGSRLPSALPVKVSLNLRHSTSLFSESALNCAFPR